MKTVRMKDEDGVKHEGGRRRTVLKEFLGDAKLKSLQSDGYSVYMYLDDELVEIEHLCCLAMYVTSSRMHITKVVKRHVSSLN